MYFNILIVCGLLVLLAAEQRRVKRWKRSIEETKAELLTVAHQMRTPLAMLQKYSVFLQNKEFGQLSFAQQEALSKGQSAMGESLLLLNTLLARMHLGEAGIPVEPARVSIRESVEAAVSAVRPFVQDKGHAFRVTGKKDSAVMADPLLLHGILDELLLNAAQYMEPGGTVEIKVQEAPRQVRISVIDKGIGVPKAEVPFIFGKFYRGEQASKMHAGNGMGLAFAKEFTAKIRGSLSYKPAPKKGSVFTLVLPKK